MYYIGTDASTVSLAAYAAANKPRRSFSYDNDAALHHQPDVHVGVAGHGG